MLTPSSVSRSGTLIVFYRDVCLFKAQLSSVPLQWHICLLSTLCRGLLFSHPWDRVKVQSESWRNILDSEKSGLGWHTGEVGGRVAASASCTECGWMHQIHWRSSHIPSSRIVAGEGCWASSRGSRPTVFLLLFRLSFRDSRRKRLSRPKVVLVLLMLLLLRTLSSMASAPSARSPVRKD